MVDCGGRHEAKGYCNKHYLRLRRHEDPGHVTPSRKLEKLAWIELLLLMEPTGLCVDWPWGKDSAGYGLLQTASGVPKRVHVVVLEMSAGPRPGQDSRRNVSLHSCDRPSCCAPWHLAWGTQSQNMRDEWDRNRRVAVVR